MNTKWIGAVRHFFLFPFSSGINVLADPDVKSQTAWYEEWRAKEGIKYDVALKYAEHKYKEVVDGSAILEKKAEWFYGLAIATIGAAVYLSPEKSITGMMWAVPSILLSGLAIKSVMSVRTPGDRPAAMTVRNAIRCVEGPEDPVPVLCGNFHIATEAAKRVNTWKSDHLRNASRALVAGFISLILTIPLSSPAKEEPSSPGANKIREPCQCPASQAQPDQVRGRQGQRRAVLPSLHHRFRN